MLCSVGLAFFIMKHYDLEAQLMTVMDDQLNRYKLIT